MQAKWNDVDWASIPGPEWYRPTNVPIALQYIADGNSNSYNNFILFAIGNNHAGTYYPAAIYALPFIREILLEGEEHSRILCMNLLEDLVIFYPEGFESLPEDFRLFPKLAEFVPLLEAVCNNRKASEKEKAAAESFLQMFREYLEEGAPDDIRRFSID